MKILVLHQNFLGERDPGGSRFNQLAGFWTDRGHQVTVISSMVNYVTGCKKEQYRWKWRVSEQQGAVRVIRTHASEAYNRTFVGRLWAMILFMLSSTLAGLLGPSHDIVLATSPPLLVGLSGYAIALLRRSRFVFEVRDLWPDSAIQAGVLRGRIAIGVARALERFLYRRAHLLVVLTPAFERALVAKGLPRDKVRFLPNGADRDLMAPGEKSNRARRLLGLDGKFVVTYVGAHGVANQLMQILESARLLAGDSEVVFMLVGDGMEKSRLQKTAASWGLRNVIFVDSVPKAEIADYINASDVCTAVLKKVPVFETVYPNKLFDYLCCGKPVILAIGGVAAELVQEAQAGVCVTPEDPEQFCAAVLKFKNDSEFARVCGENGRRYVTAHFDRPAIAEKYLNALEGLLKERAVPPPGKLRESH